QDTIVEPLGDLGFEAARIECGERVTAYRRLFLRSSEMTPEAIRDEIAAIKQRAERRKKGDFRHSFELETIIGEILANPHDPHLASLREAAALQLLQGKQQGETISQAAEAFYGELEREGVRPQTLDGHKLRVRAFVERCGDIALANVTR